VIRRLGFDRLSGSSLMEGIPEKIQIVGTATIMVITDNVIIRKRVFRCIMLKV
jgi:hypothetical protein